MADALGVSTAVPVLVVQLKLNEAERTVVVRKGDSAVSLHTGLPVSRHLDSTLIDALKGLAPEVSVWRLSMPTI